MDDVFARMYEADVKGGRPSIAPEKLVQALLLQVLYSIRSERMLVEQISCNMLFRWFVSLPMDGTVWDHSTFSKNRDRLLEHDVLVLLFNETVETARERGYLSGEHFSVDANEQTEQQLIDQPLPADVSRLPYALRGAGLVNSASKALSYG